MSDAAKPDDVNTAPEGEPQPESSIWPDDKPKEEVKEEIHLKTRPIPALVMLLGGSVTIIICFIRHYEIIHSLELILAALVIFLILGTLAREILDNIVIERPEEADDHLKRDAVIERPQQDNPPT